MPIYVFFTYICPPAVFFLKQNAEDYCIPEGREKDRFASPCYLFTGGMPVSE
jgi:hypothetical protein